MAKFNREELLATLGSVKAALGSSPLVPEYGYIWVTDGFVRAYNGTFGMETASELGFACGIPGLVVLNLLESCTDDVVSIDIDKETLRLKSGTTDIKLVTLEAARNNWAYPKTHGKNALLVDMQPDHIAALKSMAFVRAAPATRVEHLGVTMQQDKNELRFYSTDSASMAEAVVPVKKAAEVTGVMLPHDFAEQLVALAPEGAKLWVNKDCLIAETGTETVLYATLVDLAQADDMGAIISRQQALHAQLLPLPVEFEQVLTRAEILASRDEPLVYVEVQDAALQVSGTYSLGSLHESFAMKGAKPAAKVGVKAGILKRALPFVDEVSLAKGSLLLRKGELFTYVLAAVESA